MAKARRKPPANTGRQSLGLQARNAAVTELIARHRNEYTRLLGDRREAVGLPRDPNEYSRERRIEYFLRKLEELGYDPTPNEDSPQQVFPFDDPEA